MNVVETLKKNQALLPPPHSWRSMLLAGMGSFLAMGTILVLSDTVPVRLVLGSFGSSCLLLFAFPDAPFAQPRHVVGGHCLSALIGLLCLGLWGATWWSVALAVSVSVVAMMLTRTVHPPAASNPVIIAMLKPGWSFLLFPTLSGAVIIVLIALIYNNLAHKGKYPKYW
jgi:CBS-domain-containing membrane protein